MASGLLVRFAEVAIDAALRDTRVVVVTGARQVGKSTVVAALVGKRRKALVRTLDRPSELQSAKADPEQFVMHDGLLVIDEVQRAPEILLPIKARVDASNRPGQFLLTGSARIWGLKSVPDTLVGRAETIELWPLSQGELAGNGRAARTFVDILFAAQPVFPSDKLGAVTRDDYIERALCGGFPEATKRLGARRDRFFEAYVRDLIDRDVAILRDIERRNDLLRLVRALASEMATLVKVERLASQLRISASTLERHVALLEDVFLCKRLPAWSNTQTKRAVRSRKLLMVDSGLAAHLAGLSMRSLRGDPAKIGQLLENFALGELARQLGWSQASAHLFHYRTRDGEEVDAVLERNDGQVVGVEVKASMTVTRDDFRHLRHLATHAGKRFGCGVVLYTGHQVLPFGPKMWAVPMDALWM